MSDTCSAEYLKHRIMTTPFQSHANIEIGDRCDTKIIIRDTSMNAALLSDNDIHCTGNQNFTSIEICPVPDV